MVIEAQHAPPKYPAPGRSLSGVVYLVGAGPGDPGLMTQRSLELIARADVILYDRLVPAGALDGARPDAELRYVGKSPGARVDVPGGDQRAARRARPHRRDRRPAEGRRPVRVRARRRGGRGARRRPASRSRSCPGVTAGIAAPAYAGIPVTHRDEASAVAFVTGHEDPAKDESALDWQALAAFPGTLVFYMGVRRLPRDRRAADRGGAPGRRAGGRRRARHAARAADGHRAARARSRRRPPG